MNSEVIQLQSSIIKELENLPFISNLDNIFTMSATEHNTVHNITTTSSGSMGKDEGKGLDFKTSLLTLVADLVDSACHAIRNDLIASSNTTNSSGSSGVSSDTGSNSDATHSTSTSPESLLDRHLGWMRITLADGSTYSKAQLDAVARALAAQDNTTAVSDTATSSSTASATGFAETDSTPSTTNPNNTSNSSSIPVGGSSPSATEVTQRLALLPDYRAKTLYLASLVDLTAVRDIIGPQLLQRLEEVMLEGRECISRAHIQATTSTTTTADTTTSAAPEPILHTPNDPSTGEYKDTDTDTIRSPPTSPTTDAPVKDNNLNDIDDDFADIDCDIDCDIAAIDEEIAVFDADIRVTELDLPLPPLHSTVFPPTPPTTTTLPCSRSSSDSSSCSSSSGSSKSTTGTTNSLENENLAPNLPNISQPTQA